MHQTNPTEMFREPRLARQLRAESEEEEEGRMSNGNPEAVAVLERPEESSWLQILWSTGPVP